MAKNIAFNVDYSRTNLASKITWVDEQNSIEDCEPYIDFIRCDDGNEYRFLHTDKGEIVDGSLFMFEAVKDTDDCYYLCYSADFEVPDFNSKSEFVAALKKSKGLVEIVLGFKDLAGKKLNDCFEDYENRQAKMVKS